jgi:hypothetical protein
MVNPTEYRILMHRVSSTIFTSRELAEAAGEADFALETIAENPEAKRNSSPI